MMGEEVSWGTSGTGSLVGTGVELAACESVRGRAREQGREREAGFEERRAEQRRGGSSAQLAGGQASLFRAQLIWLSVGVNAAV